MPNDCRAGALPPKSAGIYSLSINVYNTSSCFAGSTKTTLERYLSVKNILIALKENRAA